MVGARRYLSVLTESVVGPNEVVLELAQSVLGSLALELALLIAGLAAALRVQPSRGAPIILRLLDDDRVSKALAERASDGSVTFAIGRNQAEYLQMVLLRAYRDEMAEVNHVHIEGDHQGQPLDLTLMFEVSAEPMSAEEANKLLND